jgi:isoleucyl-tRNA synthetase
MSFTMDEAWEQIPGCAGSVHEQRFPLLGGSAAEMGKDKKWERLWEVREGVQAAMEPHRAAKTIGTSLDAAVEITLATQADWDLLDSLGEPLDDLLVVSSIARSAASSATTPIVAVTAHPGVKCPRCWNHKGGHGRGEDAALCVRCASVVA